VGPVEGARFFLSMLKTLTIALSSDKNCHEDDPTSCLRFSAFQDVPEIRDTEVLIEVYCFSVVRLDVKLLIEHPLGTGSPSITNPMIPCMDGAGVVSEVGADVKRFKAGDCVFFTKGKRFVLVLGFVQ
jgi:NADPH:quinone reductase-like Zn-dependent oxidoreductase